MADSQHSGGSRRSRWVELGATLGWVLSSWLRPAGGESGWEQKAGHEVLAYTEPHEESRNPKSGGGNEPARSAATKVQSTGT